MPEAVPGPGAGVEGAIDQHDCGSAYDIGGADPWSLDNDQAWQFRCLAQESGGNTKKKSLPNQIKITLAKT